MASSTLPKLPTKLNGFISHVAKNKNTPMTQLLEPFKNYESQLRELYAQDPGNAILEDPYINTLPLFNGNESEIKIRARDLATESEIEKSRYIMPLPVKKRKADGAPAIVSSIKDFQYNFNIFSEQSLSELDWSNVVAAGSSALTPLLPIPKEHGANKRSIRKYYHEIVAPASDVDLFLYGLSKEAALEKIKQIERCVKDSILQETTTIRTKNAITIASQHPVRHVQIVLRIYKSISEILTGFDVDCSGVAYDGKQLHATPRAVAALMTQVNQVDLSRRSPSYESRLSKYSHRGFEVHWPQLDRTKIDPTIFERSFPRTVGLARLLVLEKLPKDADRTSYSNQRRIERGRPVIYNNNDRGLRGDIKEDNQDEVAEFVEDDQISNYHSFTIPYGPRYHARRIEKLLYTKDLLLNAEWNTKERKVNLHRHPAFIGDAEHVFEDCCGFCPEPTTDDEKLVAEEESRHYVSGKITFITDDPGRQAIGSFNPITDTDWTDMAYVGDTARICQAIVDGDLEVVQKCLKEGTDPNRRDYVGRTMLHLAAMVSTPEIVRCLLNNGAYLVPRIADGQTALHLAAVRGNAEILQVLHEKNEENKKAAEDAKNEQSAAAKEDEEASEEESGEQSDSSEESDDAEVLDHSDAESLVGSEVSAANSDVSAFLKIESVDKYIKKGPKGNKPQGDPEVGGDTSKIEPKDDIIDANAAAWDTSSTASHLATVFGNVEALKILFKQFGADPSIPVKLMHSYNTSVARDAILSLVLVLNLPLDKAEEVVKVLVAAGAKSSQANMDGVTVFQFFANHSVEMLELLKKLDKTHAKLAINHVTFSGSQNWKPQYNHPLRTAIENGDLKVVQRLLDLGAEYEIDQDMWVAAYKKKFSQAHDKQSDGFKRIYLENTEQPIILAVRHECPESVVTLIEAGADINTLNAGGALCVNGIEVHGGEFANTVLDAVRAKIDALENDDVVKPIVEPQEPQGLDDLFKDVDPDSYKHWYVTNYIRKTKQDYQKKLENYNKNLQNRKLDIPQQNRLNLVTNMLKRFKVLEEYLVEKEAKTFVELHLNKAPKEKNNDAPNNQQKSKAEQREFARRAKEAQKQEFAYKFNVEMSDAKREEYLEMFEAAWTGNHARIRYLTTTLLGENKDQPPLKITANDDYNHNPFDIALLRGHVDCAFALLDVVQAQYAPKGKQMSYVMGSDNECDNYDESEMESEMDSEMDSEMGSEMESDEESSSNDRRPTLNLYARLPASTRNQFTIDDIGQISTAVKGEYNPVDLLEGLLPLRSYAEFSKLKIDTLVDDDGRDIQASLFGYAMYKNDIDLFNKLIDMAIKYKKFVVDSDESIADSTPFTLATNDFDKALALGKPQFVAAMISRTGAGISFDHLIKKSGATVVEKSKYYQGLSIRGEKNKAWAQAYRNNWTPASMSESTPLLRACHEGSIQSVEWLLSDAPLRLYSEFAAANKDNENVQALSKLKGGFEQAISEWLGTRRELALHCALMSRWSAPTDQLISYLISVIPESLNAKSKDGRSPLHLAFALRLPSVAKLLIQAGADVEAIDKKGNNIMHVLFTIWRGTSWNSSGAPFDHEQIKDMLALLDAETVKKLLLRRNRYSEAARTPLQAWLALHSSENGNDVSNSHLYCVPEHKHCCSVATLELLLDYSGVEVLNMVDGSGDTAVHTVASKPKPHYLKAMMSANPDCIFRENAVGRNAAEVARDLWLGEQVKEPPTVGTGKSYWDTPNRTKSVISRDMGWFMTSGEPKPSSAARVWALCRERIEQAGGKQTRKLVSLAEANEVAKRLAEKPKSDDEGAVQSNDDGTAVADSKVKDEVQMWFMERMKKKSDRVYDDYCPPIPASN